VSIGRAEDNDIVIPDDTASNHHGKITRENGRIFIWDLASTPGTIVDGEKIGKDSDISKKEIRDGSIITLTQKFELEFKAITPVQPATPRLAQPAA
jgi:pSer/pThr/pTyr-binding forkhead associated (FHA) protein